MSAKKTAARAAIVLCLVAVTVAVVLAYRHALQAERRLAEQRLDPVGLRYPDFPDPPANFGAAPVVVLVGDSRAQRWPAPNDPRYAFVNRGIPDQSSEQVVERFDEQVAPLAPAFVVIVVGINDLKAIPLLPTRRDRIVGQLAYNVRALVGKVQALHAKAILVTLFPLGHVPLVRRPVWSDDVGRAVLEVNESIRALGSAGATVLDAYSLLVETNGTLRREAELDLLHLSDAGYVALNSELLRLLP